MKKLLWGLLFVFLVASVVSQDTIQDFENQVENQFISLNYRVDNLEQRVSRIEQPVESFSPKTNLINGIFFGLIALLFAMNVTTMYKMKTLSSSSPQRVKAKVNNKLKQYIDYCRFHKGQDINTCKQELRQRGWTDEQIDDALKK